MPQKIIIVRHGETQDNVEHRLQGSRNTPLNQAGHNQAKSVAKRLKEEHAHIDAIYSSHQDRALTTASYIAKELGLEIVVDPRLREDNLGVFEGQKWDSMEPDLQPLWSELEDVRSRGELHWDKHKGETFESFYARLNSFHSELETINRTGTVIIVTHGGTKNRYLELLNLKKVTDGFIGFGNTSVTIIEKVSTTYQIKLLNDTSHLI